MPIISADNLELYINTNNIQEITITDSNGVEKSIDEKSDYYNTVISIFNKKLIKIDTSTPYLYDKSANIVKIKTNKQTYELHAVNIKDNDETKRKIVFVVHDYYSTSSGQYLTQYVTVSSDEFNKLFSDIT